LGYVAGYECGVYYPGLQQISERDQSKQQSCRNTAQYRPKLAEVQYTSLGAEMKDS
jgi:hypothetical protein